jgi:hypothetical protein|tara:strand:+ start:2006 stop:2656 length:651 start_codon:yes stop_codon:yes gene_type:complete
MDIEIEWEDKPSSTFTTTPIDISTTDVFDKVLNLREIWIPRSSDFPFYTLGRCAYLDGKTDSYYKDSLWQNDILLGEFGELYEAMLKTLQEVFNEELYLAHDLSLPGFHIFPSDPKFLSIAGTWHQDYPHVTLELEGQDTYAFTLPIKLPVSGGGMDYIDEFHQPQHFAYNERDLVVHDGTVVHRISGLKKYIPNEYRITLQGHTIRRNGDLEVFW